MRTRFLSHTPAPMASTPPHRSTFSDKLADENVDNAEALVFKWDNPDSNFCNLASLFSSDNRDEAKQYLHSIKELQTAMQHYITDNSSTHKLMRAQHLMQIAMKRLEKEFHRILKSNRHSLSDSESIRCTVSGFHGDTDQDESGLGDLKAIADCMIAAGYTKECVRIYKMMRKSMVEEALYQLGFDHHHFSSSHVHKLDWETLEHRIKTWLNATKVAVKSLFYKERTLCDHVFANSASIKESCFSEITKESALALFSFPETVAVNCKKSPEKMFRFLDLYETITDLWPEIDSIFNLESVSSIKSQAGNSSIKLADAIRNMLLDFEKAITNDHSKTPVPGGGVHPLTRYVMNYVTFLADYSGPLTDILAEGPLKAPSPLPESYYVSPDVNDNGNISTAISTRLAWIILMLLCKLDSKTELYKDVALSYLFLANNLQYTVNKVRTSSLKLLLGDSWIVKHEEKVKNYASNYERIGWSKVTSSLPEMEIEVREAAECFKRFNSAFEEVYTKQSTWIVPDAKLRDEIKISVAKKVGIAYHLFYYRYRAAVIREMKDEVIVRFAPDDLGNYLSDLLHGTGGPGSVSSSSASSFSSSWSGHSSR